MLDFLSKVPPHTFECSSQTAVVAMEHSEGVHHLLKYQKGAAEILTLVQPDLDWLACRERDSM